MIVRIVHDETYEAPCGVQARVYHMCDDPPVCCSYHIELADSLDHRTWFWAFWGRSAEGLKVGQQLKLHLRRGAVYRLSECAASRSLTSTTCAHDVDYMVTGDSDVTRVGMVVPSPDAVPSTVSLL